MEVTAWLLPLTEFQLQPYIKKKKVDLFGLVLTFLIGTHKKINPQTTKIKEI